MVDFGPIPSNLYQNSVIITGKYYRKLYKCTALTNSCRLMRTTVPLYEDGRVSIPKHIRQKLNIEHGDLLELKISHPEE